MILIIGEKFENFRQFLIPSSRSKILDAGSLQTIIEKHKGQRLLLLTFKMVKTCESSC